MNLAAIRAELENEQTWRQNEIRFLTPMAHIPWRFRRQMQYLVGCRGSIARPGSRHFALLQYVKVVNQQHDVRKQLSELLVRGQKCSPPWRLVTRNQAFFGANYQMTPNSICFARRATHRTVRAFTKQAAHIPEIRSKRNQIEAHCDAEKSLSHWVTIMYFRTMITRYLV